MKIILDNRFCAGAFPQRRADISSTVNHVNDIRIDLWGGGSPHYEDIAYTIHF